MTDIGPLSYELHGNSTIIDIKRHTAAIKISENNCELLIYLVAITIFFTIEKTHAMLLRNNIY